MSKIICVVGPTGVGKTELSIALAKKYNADIINADATQVYKEANIGTAKITEKEKEGIKHYMLDVVDLDKEYTVMDYQRDARKILDNLIKKDKNVIIVGGSGLYVKALLYDYKFSQEEKNTYDFSSLSNKELKDKVDTIYKDNQIHVNNRKRLERFLSHYYNTGNIIKNNKNKDKMIYNAIIIGLTTDRNELNKHLEERVHNMLFNGLVIEALYLNKYPKVKTFIGYKEIIDYKNGITDLNEAIKEITRRTKLYAKRQYTWFNNQFDNITWFNVDYNNFDKTKKEVIDYLENL